MVWIQQRLHLDNDVYNYANYKLSYVLSLKVEGELTASNFLDNKMFVFGSSLRGTLTLYYNIEDLSEFYSQ